MSSTNSIKAKATVLKKFLNAKDYNVKHSECLEAVSNMETGHCYNVAKEKAVRILKVGEHLTFKEMKENDFKVDVIVPVDVSTILEGIEVFNDYLSGSATGNDYALHDIGYEVYPHVYGESSSSLKIYSHLFITY